VLGLDREVKALWVVKAHLSVKGHVLGRIPSLRPWCEFVLSSVCACMCFSALSTQGD
jgi:hypothetical protein